MALANGTRIGTFEITGVLGAGGMGEVYRALDTTLGRSVALKVLPDAFAQDPERLARFEREARSLAALNHPSIAQIYGVERAGTVQALVMELVEGTTLADLIARGAMSVGDTVALARQIADALEAAHEQGIVHRDLKPANIKVRPDGTVKVLDFGLAKALDPGAPIGATEATNLPTITSPAMTGMGIILGTAAYMSPEQAKGKAVDKRADIWAFGVVVFEMLSGRPLFASENVSETLAKVILKDPDWHSLPSDVPAAFRDLIRRCLARDPRHRLRDMGDARITLDEVLQGPVATSVQREAPRGARRREYVLGGLLLLFVLVTTGLIAREMLAPAPPAPPTVRFEVLPPSSNPTAAIRWLELSPDGRHLAFSAFEPESSIFVRPVDSSAVRLLVRADGTGGAPPIFFWSPDSQYVAYFADGRLRKVALAGGPAQSIGNLPPASSYRGTWSSDGVILFSALTPKGWTLWRTAATGGEPTPVGGAPAYAPVFLPDGRHYLAMSPTGEQTAEAFVGDLDSAERRPLTGLTSPPKYSSAGYLLFERDGGLLAQPFDVGRLQLSGEPVLVTENLFPALGQVSASLTGDIAFRESSLNQDTPLQWFDRTGTPIRNESLTGSLQAPNLSRDGQRVAIERRDASGADIWLIDLVRGTNTRLTDNPADDIRPVLSPDGTRVAFARDDVIYIKSSSGTGPEERLVDGEITDWSSDGKTIAFIKESDVWAVPVDGDRTPTRIVQTNGNDRRGRFSPDGKWIAYESNFSGRFEVYVQRFPPTAERMQVSANGGSSAYWRRDGKELFFSGTDPTIMAVEVTPGSTFQASKPVKLFDVPGIINNRRFVVTPDGKQFLMPIQPAQPLPITVVLNWAAGLVK